MPGAPSPITHHPVPHLHPLIPYQLPPLPFGFINPIKNTPIETSTRSAINAVLTIHHVLLLFPQQFLYFPLSAPITLLPPTMTSRGPFLSPKSWVVGSNCRPLGSGCPSGPFPPSPNLMKRQKWDFGGGAGRRRWASRARLSVCWGRMSR